MTVSVVVTVSGAKEVQDALRDPQLIKGPLKEFLREGANIVEIEAKRLVPVDTTRLRSSIMPDIAPLSARVYSNVQYAPAVELGRKPGSFPPPLAIYDWTWRNRGKFGFRLGHGAKSQKDDVGKLAYRIMWAIAKRGIKPKPFMRPAADKLKAGLPRLLDTLAAGIRQGFRRHTHGSAK